MVIPCVGPHLIVARQPTSVCFDHALMVVALSDFYHIGILQSRIHETWAWARGSTLEERLRYTNTTIFETFAFPSPTKGYYNPRERPQNAMANRIAEAAEVFDRLRAEACKQHELGLTKIHNKLKAGELPELLGAYEALNDAVNEAYGFPKGTWRDDKETLRLLLQRNKEIAEPLNQPRV